MDSVNAPLNLKEAAAFLDIAVSSLYKLTMRGIIPSYRPSGGKVYFKKEELEAWIFGNRRSSRAELDALAVKGGRK